eukprot:GEMP01011725.1.p1 GENE.GEMP01011725.1~~GEMP01011725.1.p1  ORF type:complete len:433 (+),score=93.58 GEMP01011725.1:60-1358(+)
MDSSELKRPREPNEEPEEEYDIFNEILQGDDIFGNELDDMDTPQIKRLRTDSQVATPAETPHSHAETAGPLLFDVVDSGVSKRSVAQRRFHRQDKGKLGPLNPSFVGANQTLKAEGAPDDKVRKLPMQEELPDPKMNAFEQALLRVKGPRRGLHRMTEVLAAEEAQKIVETMKDATIQDEEARRMNYPSVAKVLILKTIVARILRERVSEHFVHAGGICAIFDWISPAPGVPSKFAMPAPEIVVGMLKILNRVTVTKSIIQETKIGVRVNVIWKNKGYPNDVRRQAENLCMKWLGLIQNPDAENELLVEDPDEVKKKPKDAPIIDPTEFVPTLTTWRDPNYWVPSNEQVQRNMEISRNTRHPLIPMEKPVFAKQYLPDKEVDSKVGWNRTNPDTTIGKVDRRVQSMANPNKKSWKNSLSKPISIGARGMGEL